MKIKDLPKGTNMGDVRFINPLDGKKYWWISQWNRGVWAKVKKTDTKIYPIFVETLKECSDWEVVNTDDFN